MRRLPVFIVTFGMLAVLAMTLRTTAQDNSARTPPPQNGDQNASDGAPPKGPGGPPGGFHLLPRFVMEKLDLTDDQKNQVKQLEKETKAKLEKILTPAQVKVLQETRPPRHGPGGPGGPDAQGAGQGPGGDDGGPGGDHGGDHSQGGGQNP